MSATENKPYPLHYFATRPYTREFWNQLSTDAANVKQGAPNALAFKCIMPWLEANDWGSRSKPGELHILSQETQGLLSFGEWAYRGKELYSFAPSLVAALQNSDCKDMRVSDVVGAGTHTKYLHFGSTGIFLEPGIELEGIYVIRQEPVTLRVVLCARGKEELPALSRWRERYDLRILEHCLDLPAELAIKRALKDDLEDLDEAGRIAGTSYGAVPSLAFLRKRMVDGFPALEASLSLMLNALAYLQTYPEDAADSWGSAPERLVKQVEEGSSKERERARSKLWNLGHIKFVQVGEAYAREAGHIRGAVSAHIRRGHWRNQPHGPALAFRKLIWIRPMVIGAFSEALEKQAQPLGQTQAP